MKQNNYEKTSAPNYPENAEGVTQGPVLPPSEFDPVEHKDKTRSQIALFFVKSYFYLIGVFFLVALVYNLILHASNKSETLEIRDLLLVVTSAVGTPLGFVVGYYFKTESLKD